MIEQVISPIPKLKHRSTVVTLADQDEFVTKYEATNDHLADNTVTELNTFATQVNQAKEQINTDSQEVTKTIEETRLIKSQVEQIEKDTSQIKDETSEIKTEVEQIAGAIPQGTINDTTIAKTSVWSSEKVSEELKNAGGEVAFITHSFTDNEELTIPLNRNVNGAIVGVQKEVAQTELVNEDWLVSSDEFEGELTRSIKISSSQKSKSYALQGTNAFGMAFSTDGHKFFATSNNYNVLEYALSNAFDISSMSYLNKTFNAGSTGGGVEEICFSNDGLKLFVLRVSNYSVYEHILTSPFDISTASTSSKSFSFSLQENNVRGLSFSTDGTKMFILGVYQKSVLEYTLTTAFDISTASYSGKSFSVAEQDNFIPEGLTFSSDGLNMFFVGLKNNVCFQYTLTTAFDISTASYSDSLPLESSNPRSMLVEKNTEKMFLLEGAAINEYYMPLGAISSTTVDTYQTSTSKTPINTSLWAEINSFIPTQTLNNGEINYSFSKDNKESFIVSNGTSERTVVKNDGGVWKYNSNVVFEAETFENASVNDMNVALDEAMNSAVTEKAKAYDISTASYSNKSFSVASQDNLPYSLAFSNDGLKMFILGNATDTIYQYNLTTAFDISTASYSNKSFSVASQGNIPISLAFSLDGFKMFVLEEANKTIYQYTLTTAYDISTATYYNKSFSVASQDTAPYGLAFSNDGFKLFVLGAANRTIYQYTLTTAYDISTATYYNKSFSVVNQDTVPFDLTFSPDGLKMFMPGNTTDTIYQYDLTIAYDISTATYYNKSFSVASQDTMPVSLAFSNDGFKLFVLGAANDSIYQYSSTVQQSQNIQPLTPFELDDNLNLAITMKSTGTSPTFTNMDINYDAFSKWQEATPNTDYQAWQQGDTNNVYVKALSANNLKVRVM